METARVFFGFTEAFFSLYLIVYIVFMTLSVTVGAITLYEDGIEKQLQYAAEPDCFLPVSIIVPAYNESVTICDTINSLLKLDYSIYEIVIVDDGSTDGTCELLKKQFNMQSIQRPICRQLPCRKEKEIWVTYRNKCPITLIIKENGGKADALNAGINASEHQYVLCMDADSVLQHDALKNIVAKAVDDEEVVAVGGMIRVINNVTLKDGVLVDYRLPRSLVQCMQVIEYDRSFLASRILFDKFNGNIIISGAFGLFRKEFLSYVGGYSTDTVGEDMELVVRMHAFARANKIPYKIRYASDAVCWSQAPSTMRDLCKQRKRWHIGLFQSIFKHRGMLFDVHFGALSLISFTYFTVYELLAPYIEVLGIISLIAAICSGFFDVVSAVILLISCFILNWLLSLTAFFARTTAMDHKLKPADAVKGVFVAFIENLGMRAMLSWTRLTALIGYKKNKNKWGTIERQKYKTVEDMQENIKDSNTNI